MNGLTLIKLEWNSYNGFIFEFLHIDYSLYEHNYPHHCTRNIDNSFIGINLSKEFLYLDLFWNTIKIFDKTGIKPFNLTPLLFN